MDTTYEHRPMPIQYTIYAQPGQHDIILKRLRREVNKDKHWISKFDLKPGESQELTAVLSAVSSLGLHLFRVETDKVRDTHNVIIGA
jgi:hypothetical protein